MAAGFSGLLLCVFAGILSASTVAAQGTVWRIDSTRSTARLYVTSSKRREARINVGVARLSGNVLQNAGTFLPGTVSFQIFSADRNGKPVPSQGSGPVSPTRIRAGSATLAFRSKTIELLDEKTVLVRGDMTATYVSRTAEYDPSKGYSGPVFGPPVTHSAKRNIAFVFREAAPAGTPGTKRGSVEWSASSIIPDDLFPELWNAVVTTDWPVFILEEQCNTPPGAGEDFSGPACTGKLVEPAPRTDMVCAMPSSVGEDFSGITCSGTPLLAVPKPEGKRGTGGGQSGQVSSGSMANEVEIELVIRLEKMNSVPQKQPAGPGDPTARHNSGKPLGAGPA
jgi:hypothetical protein